MRGVIDAWFVEEVLPLSGRMVGLPAAPRQPPRPRTLRQRSFAAYIAAAHGVTGLPMSTWGAHW